MRRNFGPKNFLYPMPVLILGTYDENGVPNAMNAAWGGTYDYDEIVVSLGDHKTTDNLKLTNSFTIGIGDEKSVVACDYVGIVSAKKVPNKVDKAGFTVQKSEYVNAPIFLELPITMECTVKSFQDGILVGKIVNVSADESILGNDGLPSLEKFSPITFDTIHMNYVKLGEVVGKAFSDGKKIK